MITYGHENFIEEAINGVLMQECDFEIELVISNDCSPDKTDEVIQRILKAHRKAAVIKYTKLDTNIGMVPNFIFALKQCKGEYVALCEGDDYWTDPLKLQKQVDFLEVNLEYVLHSGNAIQLSLDLTINGKVVVNKITDTSFSLTDFLSNNNLVTCTVMFRNIKFEFPKCFYKATFADWFLYVILMHNSGQKAYRSKEVFSVYRIHEAGVMLNLSELNYCSTHILQIISIRKYLGNKRIELKEINIINRYSLQKYVLVLKDKKYFEVLKTIGINFWHCRFEMPFKDYCRALKHQFF